MKQLLKEFIRFALLIVSMAIFLGLWFSSQSASAQDMHFAYNSTSVVSSDLSIAHNLPAGQEFEVTGYACGIGSHSAEGRLRNEQLAAARAEVLADSLRNLGHVVTITISITMSPDQRGSQYWAARAEWIETDQPTETGLPVETSADDSMYTFNSPVQSGDSIVDVESTVDTMGSNFLGLRQNDDESAENFSAGSDSMQSPRQHEGSFSIESITRQPITTTQSPISIPATAAQVLDSMLSEEGMECDCGFPAELTPANTLAWRRSSYVVRGRVNSHTKAHHWAECGDRCLKLMLRFEHQQWGLHSAERLGASPTPSQKARAARHEAKEKEKRERERSRAQRRAMRKSSGMSGWDWFCVWMGWSCK